MASNELVIRNAKLEDLQFPIRFVVEHKWRPFGPGDYLCAYKYDPKGFFVGEVDGEVVSHVMLISYPDHSTHCGSLMIQKEHRNKRYAEQMLKHVSKIVDSTFTISLDSLPYMISFFESFGFSTAWENAIAMLSFEKIISKVKLEAEGSVTMKLIKSVDIDKLVEYDTSVFGCKRHVLVENWIKIPGSMGWVAHDRDGKIVGYTLVRPIILNYGGEIGMNMAPLYAENNKVASALLKIAAETCLANDAVAATNFLLIYAKGADHSKNASELFDCVEAEYLPFATRMYLKGPPQDGELNKIYGIMHPTID